MLLRDVEDILWESGSPEADPRPEAVAEIPQRLGSVVFLHYPYGPLVGPSD
jgi:hypothetical protein